MNGFAVNDEIVSPAHANSLLRLGHAPPVSQFRISQTLAAIYSGLMPWASMNFVQFAISFSSFIFRSLPGA
jgi:hypothetical protein